MKQFKKTVNPIKATKEGLGQGNGAQCFIKIEYSNTLNPTHEPSLSISGHFSRYRHSCGQIIMDLIHWRPFRDYVVNDGWTNKDFQRLLKIWEEWHLNDSHAGCEHQRALGWEKEGYEKHPSEPCPVCGYKFGTSWNRVEVPKDVLEWLYNLPEYKNQ